MSRKLIFSLFGFFLAGLVSACGNGPAVPPQDGEVPPAAVPTLVPPAVPSTAVPSPTAVPTAEPSAVPTETLPTGEPAQSPPEFFQALEEAGADCRRFAGSIAQWQNRAETAYLQTLLRQVGMDLDTLGPPWGNGYIWTGDEFLTRQEYQDPQTEFCYFLVTAEDFELLKRTSPDGGTVTTIPVPKGSGTLVYERPDGALVIREVFYGERPAQPSVPAAEVTMAVTNSGEAVLMIAGNCRVIEGSALEEAGSAILDAVLEPDSGLRGEFRIIPFFTDRGMCAIALLTPTGEASLMIPDSTLIYETDSGEIWVIYTGDSAEASFKSRSA